MSDHTQIIVTSTENGTFAFAADTPAQAKAALISVFFAQVEDGKIDMTHQFYDEAINGLDDSAILAVMADHGHLYEIVTLIDSSEVYRHDWKRRLMMIRAVRSDGQG